MDPKRSSSSVLLAPPHGGYSTPLRLPSVGERLSVDQHVVKPETREELVRGRRVVAMPAKPPHADRHFKLDYIIGAHIKEGYVGSTELLTRSADNSDFATDTCVRRDGIDPRTETRYLEELAFEVVNEQTLRDITEKAQDLSARGVRRVMAIFVKTGEACEWSAKQGEWLKLDPEGTFSDPTLARPLRVKELLDAAEADNAVALALLAKNNPVLAQKLAEGEKNGLAEGKQQGLAEGKQQGLAEGKQQGLAEGKQQGLAEGKKQGLKQGIEIACELLGIALPSERRAYLDELDAAGLESLLVYLRTERRLPSP